MTSANQNFSKIADETEITEITLQADGRVYVFGLSRDVLEILQGLNPTSQPLHSLIHHVRDLETRGFSRDHPTAPDQRKEDIA